VRSGGCGDGTPYWGRRQLGRRSGQGRVSLSGSLLATRLGLAWVQDGSLGEKKGSLNTRIGYRYYPITLLPSWKAGKGEGEKGGENPQQHKNFWIKIPKDQNVSKNVGHGRSKRGSERSARGMIPAQRSSSSEREGTPAELPRKEKPRRRKCVARQSVQLRHLAEEPRLQGREKTQNARSEGRFLLTLSPFSARPGYET